MTNAILIAGVAVIAIVAFVAIFAATRPKSFHVERSARISAPAGVVFPLINDFHQWNRWSPYEKRDPNMQKTIDGPAAGPGATFSWSGNAMAGAGRTTIVDSRKDERIAIKLEMTKPFACANDVTFTFASTGDATRVTWAMDGQSSFVARAMSLVMNMDKMIGTDFEDGLANLDAVAQADATRLGQAAQATPANT